MNVKDRAKAIGQMLLEENVRIVLGDKEYPLIVTEVRPEVGTISPLFSGYVALNLDERSGLNHCGIGSIPAEEQPE